MDRSWTADSCGCVTPIQYEYLLYIYTHDIIHRETINTTWNNNFKKRFSPHINLEEAVRKQIICLVSVVFSLTYLILVGGRCILKHFVHRFVTFDVSRDGERMMLHKKHHCDIRRVPRRNILVEGRCKH